MMKAAIDRKGYLVVTVEPDDIIGWTGDRYQGNQPIVFRKKLARHELMVLEPVKFVEPAT